jgi:N-carbamoylputrescine amidase
VWDSESGLSAAHTKYYLPEEEGFWEATWYQRGDGLFDIVEVKGIRIGFLICTEIWFNAHARAYASQGIHLLVCPRATPQTSVDKWIAAGRTAAVVAGAFCLSSNFSGPNVAGMAFGGTGWIIEPEAGRILGRTTPAHNVVTLDINPAEADQAKTTYPRYVED